MNDAALTSFMHQLADEAGAIARRHFRTTLHAEQKADSSPVTIADREIEQRLRQLIMAQYPQHGILGEEQSAHQPEARWQWVIDPIDGTRAFMAGIATFTTLIALCENAMPIAGIIDQPITRERWLTSELKPKPHNAPDVLKQASLATTSFLYFTPDEQAAFESLKAACASTLLGGDAYLYAMLASGHLDVVVDSGLKPYDFAALVPVVTSHGGIISDWQGKPLTLTSNGRVLAARTKLLHQQALDKLTFSAAAS
jgi:histidinol phosphatase-like enzyme (inositol monophosphatase family)